MLEAASVGFARAMVCASDRRSRSTSQPPRGERLFRRVFDCRVIRVAEVRAEPSDVDIAFGVETDVSCWRIIAMRWPVIARHPQLVAVPIILDGGVVRARTHAIAPAGHIDILVIVERKRQGAIVPMGRAVVEGEPDLV